MVDHAEFAARAAFTSLALATMGADAEWDRRLSEYLCADAMMNADATFGAYSVEKERYDAESLSIKETFGENWQVSPRAAKLHRTAYQREARANECWSAKYCEPQWQSAISLAQTPAPTLHAALFKVQLIMREDLQMDGLVGEQMFAHVAADMARLGASGGDAEAGEG